MFCSCSVTLSGNLCSSPPNCSKVLYSHLPLPSATPSPSPHAPDCAVGIDPSLLASDAIFSTCSALHRALPLVSVQCNAARLCTVQRHLSLYSATPLVSAQCNAARLCTVQRSTPLHSATPLVSAQCNAARLCAVQRSTPLHSATPLVSVQCNGARLWTEQRRSSLHTVQRRSSLYSATPLVSAYSAKCNAVHSATPLTHAQCTSPALHRSQHSTQHSIMQCSLQQHSSALYILYSLQHLVSAQCTCTCSTLQLGQCSVERASIVSTCDDTKRFTINYIIIMILKSASNANKKLHHWLHCKLICRRTEPIVNY